MTRTTAAPARPISARTRAPYVRELSWLSVSGQISGLSSVLTTILLARTVSLVEVGQVAFAQSMASLLFLLLDPRFEDAVQRYVPLLRRESELRARMLYWRLVRWDITLGLGVAAAAGAGWLAGAYPDTEVCRPAFLALAIAAQGIAAAVGTLHSGYAVSGGLTMLGRISLAASIVTAVLSAAATVLFGATGYLAGGVAGAAVQIGLLLPYCVRHLGPSGAGSAQGHVDRSLPDGFLRFVAGSSLSASAGMGPETGFLAVAGFSGGPHLVALLRIAGAPGRMLVSVCSPVAAVLFPRLSMLAAAGDRDAVRRLTARATRALLPVAVLAVLVSLPVMRPALGAVYGEQYQAAAVLAILLMVASALRVLVIWSKVLPFAIGRPGLRLGSVAVESFTVMVGAYVIPWLLPHVDAASLGIGWVMVAVAIGLSVFWAWMSRRPGLVPKG